MFATSPCGGPGDVPGCLMKKNLCMPHTPPLAENGSRHHRRMALGSLFLVSPYKGEPCAVCRAGIGRQTCAKVSFVARPHAALVDSGEDTPKPRKDQWFIIQKFR
jgi:hypothetical protein